MKKPEWKSEVREKRVSHEVGTNEIRQKGGTKRNDEEQ